MDAAQASEAGGMREMQACGLGRNAQGQQVAEAPLGCEQMKEIPFIGKMFLLAGLFVWVLLGFHSDSVAYRQECRSVIKSQSEDFEICYACRWTKHPELDKWWGDWTVGDGENNLTDLQAEELKALARN